MNKLQKHYLVLVRNRISCIEDKVIESYTLWYMLRKKYQGLNKEPTSGLVDRVKTGGVNLSEWSHSDYLSSVSLGSVTTI